MHMHMHINTYILTYTCILRQTTETQVAAWEKLEQELRDQNAKSERALAKVTKEHEKLGKSERTLDYLAKENERLGQETKVL
jgi:CDP-diacylglycerol pyrophosphatase